MYGAAAAAAAAVGGGDGGGGGGDTAYPPPAHMGIQPLYVDSKTAGKSPSEVLDLRPKRSEQTSFYADDVHRCGTFYALQCFIKKYTGSGKKVTP